MISLDNILKFRRWERGKRVNFGRLLSFISEVRDLQKELECGKVFPSSYLATYSKHKDKNYILVIDMIKSKDSVFENKPVTHAQLIVGRNQVIVRIKDFNSKENIKTELVFDSEENVIKIAKGLLELFKKDGIFPVDTADIYFGQFMNRFQTSFDDTFELMEDDELDALNEKVKEYGFALGKRGSTIELDNFILNVNGKNIYKDFIFSLTDNNDRSNIHWAIKEERLKEFVEGIKEAYNEWITQRSG